MVAMLVNLPLIAVPSALTPAMIAMPMPAGNQRVLDRGGAGLVLHETSKKVLHD